jgi:hypothetical protein
MLSFLLPLTRTIRPGQRYLNQATVPFTAMEAAAQKKSNSWRWAAILDYERRLANPHSVHRRRWFDFHPGHVCR